jgi:hypothetical protein
VPAKPWDELSPNEKADALQQQFHDYAAIERQNLQARADRHDMLERRVAELEGALKQMASQLARLEGKNEG